MKHVFAHPAARLELLDSMIYYSGREADLGLEFRAAARESIFLIRQDPDRNAVRKDGCRRYVMRRFPFIIHYLNKPDYIWILAIAHASRKPGYWRRRLEDGD